MDWWDLAYFGIFFACNLAALKAAGGYNARYWTAVIAGFVMLNIGYAKGRFDQRDLVERNTPILLDRNMPR